MTKMQSSHFCSINTNVLVKNIIFFMPPQMEKGDFGRNKKAQIPYNQHQTLKVWFRDYPTGSEGKVTIMQIQNLSVLLTLMLVRRCSQISLDIHLTLFKRESRPWSWFSQGPNLGPAKGRTKVLSIGSFSSFLAAVPVKDWVLFTDQVTSVF